MFSFLRQLKALIYKNLLVTVARRPFGFLFSIWGFPLAILALLLSIPSLLPTLNTFGVSKAAPIRSLADTVDRKLAIVRPLELASDVDHVIETFTKPVKKDLLVLHKNESSLLSVCLPNTRGVSDCHAVVIFHDSPLTTAAVPGPQTNKTHTWRYTIRADPARNNQNFDVRQHKSDQEDLYMPLQLAINNAITNSTTIPETVIFTPQEQSEEEQKNMNSKAAIIGRIYVFALIATHFSIIYRLTNFVTSERDSGMAQLIDSMGGGTTIATRVLSWLITFDLVALPCYVGLGVLYQRLAFPASGAAAIIGWQILLGFAINSSTVFAAAFFSKSRVSAIYVVFVFILLSIVAQMYASETKPHPQSSTVSALSLLFPSANNVYFVQQLCLWQLSGLGFDANKMPAEIPGLFSTSYAVSQSAMLGYLALDIFLYPMAAIGIEKLLHGIHYRKRRLSDKSLGSTGVAAQTLNLRKEFAPSLATRICCCGRRKTVTAVEDVSFRAQKGQIMCLVGPNGSGKTTTLHMMSGFISPTGGSLVLAAAPSQIGICPQQNTLWDDLTVQEHVYLWDRIKSGNKSRAELTSLIEQCDLYPKRNFKAKELSGGQKRKLQLACMFVGDPLVCLIDECTSGLDPVSRRAIWEILLQQRSKRSIIFTTHFLDEVDVLADHIVLLSEGKVKCQGAPAQLKNLHGGGYKVLVPISAENLGHDYPRAIHQDKLTYTVPDSRSASQLISACLAQGVTDVAVNGPQFEDVFLNLLQDDNLLGQVKDTVALDSGFAMSPGMVISSWAQFRILYRKRWTVLARFWSPYFFALIVPLAVTFLIGGLLQDYRPPSCNALQDTFPVDISALSWGESCTAGESCDQLSIAPTPANASLFGLVQSGYQELSNVSVGSYAKFVAVHDSRDKMLSHIARNITGAGYGGVFAGSPTEASVIAYRMFNFGDQSGSRLLDIWSQIQGGVEINSSQELMPQTRKGADISSIAYLLCYTLIQVLYPAFFVLYPAIEQSRKVRAMQYANGVRRAPLWAAYGSFDFLWILSVSTGVTLLGSLKVQFNGPLLLLLLILALYGLAATLMGYAVAHFTEGPLKSYLATLGLGMLSSILIGIAIATSNGTDGQANMSMAAVTFAANLFLPIGNVIRTLLVGYNMMEAGCKDGKPIPMGSMDGFGGPLLYLVIQVATLLVVITWLEGSLPNLKLGKFKVGGPLHVHDGDVELATMHSQNAQHARDPVAMETARAEEADSDLLRVLHVSKAFGSNRAVDDLTFGLPKNDVMALIGPNGAGKSTLVNMIQAELSPDQGRVMLCQEDGRWPSSRKNLGVCPQHDAPDLMNTRDSLSFYARIKGIKGVKGNVNYIMDKLNLTPHASTQASKLSGGNKRKLMLAIAILGMPSVVVLDEPTSAMDAVAKRQFWRVIQEVAQGRSILLTTHSMEEADALSTRTAIMARRFLAIGTTQALREQYSNMYFASLVLTSAPTSTTQEMGRVGDWVQHCVPGAQFERESLGGQIRFTFPAAAGGECGASPVARLIEMLERDKATMGIEYYSISGPTLEDVFLGVIRKNQVAEEDSVLARRGWKTAFTRATSLFSRKGAWVQI